MNNENKPPVLTLEHLAPYLPYGIRANVGETERNITAVSLDSPFVFVSSWKGSREKEMVSIEDIKPILRPISDLTIEIEHNGERFSPKNRIDQYTQVGGDGKLYLLVDGALWSCNPLLWDYYLVVKLISWHFDVFGLIDKGLAIDINSVQPGKEGSNGKAS